MVFDSLAEQRHGRPESQPLSDWRDPAWTGRGRLPLSISDGIDFPADRFDDRLCFRQLPTTAQSTMEPLILVVEDDDLMRKAAVRILMAAGYLVLEAASAEEALTVLEGNPNVALLFTDIIMPG